MRTGVTIHGGMYAGRVLYGCHEEIDEYGRRRVVDDAPGDGWRDYDAEAKDAALDWEDDE